MKYALATLFATTWTFCTNTNTHQRGQREGNVNTLEKADPKVANEKLLSLVRKEKKVKEAIITDVNVLYVSVKSDGTNRNGYADYICHLIKESGSTIRWVKIVEAGTTNSPNATNAYGVLLGESHCEFLGN